MSEHGVEPDRTKTTDNNVPEESLCGTTGDLATCSVPRAPTASNDVRGRKLVLHIDLNNTILVSDVCQGQLTEDALDCYLRTVTWGTVNTQGEWEWLSDSPSLLPPCEEAVRFSSQFGETGSGFTRAQGRRFRGVLEQHLELLRWPKGVQGDRELAMEGEDGRLYHWILPSFFRLLSDLAREGQEFAVVFRTFGDDLPGVLRAMSRALDHGAHPLFPELPGLKVKAKLSLNMTPGMISCSSQGTVLRRGQERVSTRDGERDMYTYLSSVQGVGGFVDDYSWWIRNGCGSRGGKPLWVDPFDGDVQHIFFDDNIRQNDEDTVLLPKVFLDPVGAETRTASISELYDISLVQNDLLRAISDPSYFTRRVHACRDNYHRTIARVKGRSSI